MAKGKISASKATGAHVRLREKLSATAIEKHQSRSRRTGERITIADTACGGLVLTIGARTSVYSVACRRPGVKADGKRYQQQWHSIGDSIAVSVEEARAKAAEIKLQVKNGGDPTEEKKKATQAAALLENDISQSAKARQQAIANALNPDVKIATNLAALADATLDQCREVYLLRGLDVSKVGDAHVGNIKRALRDAMKLIVDDKTLPIGRLRPAQLQKVFVEAFQRQGVEQPVLTNDRTRELRRMLNWLVVEGALERNPIGDMKALPQPKPREGKTSAVLFQRLWQAADELPQERADLLKLQILIPGMRRQTVADLEVGWVDLRHGGDVSTITIPADRSKNDMTQTFPLVGEALQIVKRLHDDATAQKKRPDAYLIPLTATGKRFCAWASATDQIDVRLDPQYVGRKVVEQINAGRRKLKDGERLKPAHHIMRHDFRRAFASEMGKHQIGDLLSIDELLGHGGIRSVGAAAHYHQGNRAPRLAPIMMAWDKMIHFAVRNGRWPSAVELNGTSDNVVGFTKKASA